MEWSEENARNLFINATLESKDLQDFLEIFDPQKYRCIASDSVKNFYITTVWVGIRLVEEKNFETLVKSDNELIERIVYETLDQAQNGHDEVVSKYQKIAN